MAMPCPLEYIDVPQTLLKLVLAVIEQSPNGTKLQSKR
ncbi:hypothetical protein NIES22_24510 [Calothrix brevissima NIES-22]|nr:hypothetical protein NIES22_24510 [Calothrix brevissima NIES-22]